MKNWSTRTLPFVSIILLLLACDQGPQLPILNPSDFNKALVDSSLQNKSENHKVLDFELINQNGKKISQQDYANTIYVVDFIFTRCESICPIMTNNLYKIQNTFINNDDIKFLSISVTPDIDSISVLKEYAKHNGANDAKWNICTGNKKHIYELARKSYFAVVEDGDGGLQDFIHTPNFILVDKNKHIRGVYDGTKDSEIQRLTKDIEILL